jgi:hypothetical protein
MVLSELKPADEVNFINGSQGVIRIKLVTAWGTETVCSLRPGAGSSSGSAQRPPRCSSPTRRTTTLGCGLYASEANRRQHTTDVGGAMTPQQRAHLMRLSTWVGLALGFSLGAALLAWWFE